MTLWQQVRETIINTARSTKAIAVDSVETFQHHQTLSLNKKADTIRRTDSEIEGSEVAVGYFKQKASIAAQARQEAATRQLKDGDRLNSENRLVGIYDAVTSDLETLKEASNVLWGYVKTADTLARATVKDTQLDIQAVLDSVDGKLLKQATKETLEEITAPIQQVWQNTTDNVRSMDLDSKGQEMLDYFQDLGRGR